MSRSGHDADSSMGHGSHSVAVEALARRILKGTYREGDSLVMPEVRAELDVTQTVLREAVKVLTTKGLLDTDKKRGTFVRPREDWNLLDADVLRWKLAAGVSSDFFADVLELRRSIEPAAAALAAERRTDDDLAALDAALSAMAATDNDPVLLVRADASFHTAMLIASNNRFYAQMHRVIVPVLVQRDRAVLTADGAFEHPHAVHAAVVEAVRNRDVDGAYMAMLELLDLSAREHP
ncbi:MULTISPECIES: FadR/GntR family transcriptional regulator [Streptomyces]|uniref:FadR/GntR family transcriptional regulator n=1 Tax=Streptomyces TaxID=1883 RepID=UPI001FCB61FB|nr:MULTISPECIES: FCD domain-containing protein [Streptomyces]MCL7493317.1 FCD domain-containing protein [Streptomyces sp. MCA2]BDH10379.1 GntR family transcriptional regulator [Streptomyces hygroscopicus]